MASQSNASKRRIDNRLWTEIGDRGRVGDLPGWLGFHFFYHADLDRLFAGLMHPLIEDLLRHGLIDRFFLIRYALGGQHARLRLRPTSPARNGRRPARDIASLVRARADAFFAAHPSTETLSEEAILARNKGIVKGDPLASDADDVAYPDNSMRRFPVRFEIDRYGGESLLEPTLDYFTVSSLQCLRLLASNPRPSPGTHLSRSFRIMTRQAWGLAHDGGAFLDLMGYAVRFMGTPLKACVEEGDRVFEASRDTLCRLVETELAALADDPSLPDTESPGSFAEASRCLAEAIRHVEVAPRWFIGASQMHMTANRLGVYNPQEVYLGRMMSRAATAVSKSDPALWRHTWERRAEATASPGGLRALTESLLESVDGDSTP